MKNPMNPNFENYDDYMAYRKSMIKHQKIQILDGISLNDDALLDSYKDASKITFLKENTYIQNKSCFSDIEPNKRIDLNPNLEEKENVQPNKKSSSKIKKTTFSKAKQFGNKEKFYNDL